MKKILRFLIAMLIGIAVCLTILFVKDIFSAQTPQEIYKILSDAFAVPGILLLLGGVFVWIVRQGTFSGMGYAFRQIWNALHSQKYRDEHKETFSEYRERKSGGEKPSFLYLIIIGSAFLLPGIIFSILFILI